MNNVHYFPHDYHARHDPKLEKVKIEMGLAGIGVYWVLIEMLYENNGTLSINEIPLYAKIIGVEEEIIHKIVGKSDLFYTNKMKFHSKGVLKRLSHINDKREKARASAEVRWNASALRPQCEGNAIKESKVKERKGKERKVKETFRSPESGELAEQLKLFILTNNPKTLITDSQLSNWKLEADLILRVDKRLFEEAKGLLEWCQRDSFWKTNILSMATFRRQYDKLTLHSKRKTKGEVDHSGLMQFRNETKAKWEEEENEKN